MIADPQSKVTQLERVVLRDHNRSSVSQNEVESISVTPNQTISISSNGEGMSGLQPNEFPDGGLRANSVILGSLLGLIANFGMVNSVGAIQAYISTHQLEGVKESSISWVFSIYMWIPLFGSVFIGPIFDYIGPTILLTIGVILALWGYLALSWSSSLYQFLLSLSFCLGISHALCITPLVGLINHWFLGHRARALGIASCGGSIGGTLLPLMLKSLYSRLSYGWAIRIIGFFNLTCMIILIFLVKGFNRTMKINREGNTPKSKQLILTIKSFLDFSPFKDTKFTLLVAGVFSSEVALMSLLAYYASYAIAQGMSESSSYLLLTIFNAIGVLGRFLPGILADKYGPFNIMILMLVGFSLSILVLLLPFGSHIPVLYVFAIVCGFFSSSILSLTPVCLSAITPVRQFGQHYGLMYCVSSTGILFGVPIGAALIGDGNQANYTKFILFCSIFSIMGTVSWILSRYCMVGFRINVKI